MDPGVSGPPPAPPEFTGERMIPEGAGTGTFWEHIYRYRFAAGFAPGRDVLDVACGEGYGSAALARAGAKSLVGVDVDPAACAYARRKYGIDARPGDAAALPFPAASFDLVVSFETVEHVPEPARFLDECARVLRPDGVLVISTPNVAVYNPDHDPGHNPFHCAEMTEAEFAAATSARFGATRMYAQCPTAGSSWSAAGVRRYDSPWRGVRGFWRLRARCRVFRHDLDAACRADPVGEVLRPEGWLSRRVNPYLVTPRARRAADAPVYLVCVARAPRKAAP